MFLTFYFSYFLQLYYNVGRYNIGRQSPPLNTRKRFEQVFYSFFFFTTTIRPSIDNLHMTILYYMYSVYTPHSTCNHIIIILLLLCDYEDG